MATTDRIDVSSMVDEAMNEEVTLEGLAEKEELSADDLRGYLGDDAKELDDTALLAAWKETAGEGEATKPTGTPAEGTEAPPATAAWDRPWKFFKGDAAVEDVSKFTAKDFLEAAIGYKAGGADQKRSLDELVRLAQRVPLDEQRLSGLNEQLREQTRSLQELKQASEKDASDRQTWMWALQDPTGERFRKLQEAWFNAGPPESRAAPSTDASEQERVGEEFYRSSIMPHLQGMARGYSTDGGAPTPEVVQHLSSEIDNYFRQLVEAEAGAMGNPRYAAARIQQIIQYDIPAALAEAGYKPAGRAVAQATRTPPAVVPQQQPTGEIASLKAKITNLQTELAKEKVRRAPGAGAGVAAGTGKGGPDLSKAKSFNEVLEIMRSPETQWDVN